MSEDCVVLKIPTAREKLKGGFPQDPKGDFRLVFKSKVFNLQKAHLRLESGYFKKVCAPNVNILEIKQNFQEQFFYNVMFCFYGASISVDRTDLPSYYPIIYYLQIESLLNFIRQDILNAIEHYDLFVVMRIAHTHTDQQLFQMCLQQLQKESFEQLRYHPFELLQTDLPLFKLIIKSHNRFRNNGGNGLPYIEIDQILRQYCETKGLGPERYQELKFELIDKTSLTSAEYKQIFLNQAIKMKTRASMIMDSNQNQMLGNTGGLNKLVTNTNLAQSVLGTNVMIRSGFGNNSNYSSNVTNELTLEMENTFQKKKNEELKSQNTYLWKQLEELKQMTKQNTDIHQQMEIQLQKLKAQLKKKQAIEKQHKNKISGFQSIIKKMQKQLLEKSKAIDQLAEQFEELKKRKPLSDDEDNEVTEDMFVQSQFLPAHLINEMMGGGYQQKKDKGAAKQAQKKSQPASINQSIDEEQLEQMYSARLKFDQEPISTPKIQLPKLVGFICGEDFNRKVLTLIYRRAADHPAFGQDSDIRNRNNLLILIHTATGQNIGGYISVNVPSNSADYVRDPGAFLFTLTKNQKFQVKKSEADEAIFLSEEYLISFANDLMISSNCLTKESYCSWPSSYETAKSVKERGSVWFAGGNDFLIKEIQIYELSEEEMVMEL